MSYSSWSEEDELANSEEETGAWVKDEDGVEFFLPDSLVGEFDEADESLGDDGAFFGWFRNWRSKNGLRRKDEQRKRSSKRRSEVVGSNWSSFWHTSDKKPTYLSEWALGGVHSTFRSTDDTVRRLAVALQAVGSTTRVIEPPSTRFTVRFTDEKGADAPQSFTSYAEKLISVSPSALLDKSIPEGEGIDVTIGWSLHEASHVRDSMPLSSAVAGLTPVAVASLMLNLAEDVRIERNTSEEFPGFAAYFDVANGYLWGKQAEDAPRAMSSKLSERIGIAILSVKWPTEYEPIARGDADLSVEFDWWREWIAAYVGGRAPRATVQAALDHLREDEETGKGMKEVEDAESSWNDFLSKLQQGMSKLDEMGKRIRSCPTHGREHGIPGRAATPAESREAVSSAVNEEAERLVEEELRVDKPYVPWRSSGGAKKPDIVVLKPNRRSGKLPPLSGSLVARMRQAFKFRPVAREWHTRNLKSGRIDAPQLWRVADGDFKVFERKMVESKPDTSVTLLIDQSGSMGVTKLNSAIEAARIIHACLKDMNGVKVRVRSHTADCRDCGSGNAVVYRIWEQGEPVERLAMIHELPHYNNADGYAIEWCARELIDNTREREQRLLIVLSDGQPAFYGYSDVEGRGYGYDHVKTVVDWAERSGVTVVQIAVDDDLHMDEQQRMFRRWIPFQGLDRLPMQITNLLRETL